MKSERSIYKLEIFLPESHLEAVCRALWSADAGHIGAYDRCLSWSRVQSCWRPLPGTSPFLGAPGELCRAEEIKVEVCCLGERLEETLSLLGIADLRRRQISSLSGGQKQKVAIAAILAMQPEIILLDEPTGELDPESSVMIFELLKALNRDYGKTVVVVEQKIMLLCSYVNRIILMEKGRVAFDGPTGAVAGKAGLFREQGINIPRVTELGENLRAMGLYNGQLPLTLEGGEKMAREVMAGAGIS